MLRAIVQNFFDNPILTRELRRRMRGRALLFSIIGYIVLMTVTSLLILMASAEIFSSRGTTTIGQLARMADTGQRLFVGIAIIQSLLVLIIAPTITAGMTTGEKEKKTFDFLRVTTISPWMYILGCFLSTVFYVALALLCALPLISLAFLYGGVGTMDVVRVSVLLLLTSMVLSAFGLFISSVRERTRTAQGVVVFIIFSLLFGGGILYDRLTAWLGTGGGAMPMAGPGAGAAPPPSGGLVLLGYEFGAFEAMVGGLIFLTLVLLIMAARKLFDTEESRALSHWQFGILSVLALAVMIGASSGQELTNVLFLTFMSMGCLLLLTAVLCFGVGRMEVGDEIWHLKRLFPFLRPFDQTIPFLILVGLGWIYASGLLADRVGAMGALNRGTIVSVASVTVASFAFLCLFARFATAVTVGRRGAGRLTSGAALAFWVLPLLVSAVLHLLAGGAGGGTDALATMTARISPLGMMVECVNHPGRFDGMTSFVNAMTAFPLGLYAVLGSLFLVLGEYKRFRRWRGFDYHYDMPNA